jgi:uncharacterized membrane protein YgcG
LHHRIVCSSLALAAAFLSALPLAAQLQLPAPVGHVNDFAHVIPQQTVARIEGVVADVRARSGGEIVVVTLPSLQGESADAVALRIGREWKVGRGGDHADPAEGTGTVLLVVPSEHQWKIELGTRTGTFITAAQAGRIGHDEMVPAFRRGDFGGGILAGVGAIAGRYGEHFGFTPAPVPAAAPEAAPGDPSYGITSPAFEDDPAPRPGELPAESSDLPVYLAGALLLALLVAVGWRISNRRSGYYAAPRRRRAGSSPSSRASRRAAWDASDALTVGTLLDWVEDLDGEDLLRRPGVSTGIDTPPVFDLGASSSGSTGGTDFGGGGSFSGGGAGGSW